VEWKVLSSSLAKSSELFGHSRRKVTVRA
jgi:hypothetical protein